MDDAGKRVIPHRGFDARLHASFWRGGFSLHESAIRRIRACAGMAGNPENPIIPRIPILATACRHIALAIVNLGSGQSHEEG